MPNNNLDVSGMSTEEMDWMDRVDTVDPFYATEGELQDLLKSAPTPALRQWLEGQIEQNKAFESQLFAKGTS